MSRSRPMRFEVESESVTISWRDATGKAILSAGFGLSHKEISADGTIALQCKGPHGGTLTVRIRAELLEDVPPAGSEPFTAEDHARGAIDRVLARTTL